MARKSIYELLTNKRNGNANGASQPNTMEGQDGGWHDEKKKVVDSSPQHPLMQSLSQSSNSQGGVPSPTEKVLPSGNYGTSTEVPPVSDEGGVFYTKKGPLGGNTETPTELPSGRMSMPENAQKMAETVDLPDRPSKDVKSVQNPVKTPENGGLLSSGKGENGTGTKPVSENLDLSHHGNTKYLHENRGGDEKKEEPVRSKGEEKPAESAEDVRKRFSMSGDVVSNPVVDKVVKEAEKKNAERRDYFDKHAAPYQKPEEDEYEKELNDKRKKLGDKIDQWWNDYEEAKGKHRKRQIINAIGDGLTALSNLFFTGRGAPSMKLGPETSSLKKADKYFERMKKERLGERDNLLKQQENLEALAYRLGQDKKRNKLAADKLKFDMAKDAYTRSWNEKKLNAELGEKEKDRKAKNDNAEADRKLKQEEGAKNRQNARTVAQIRKGNGGSGSGRSKGSGSGSGSGNSSGRLYYRGNNGHRHSFDKRNLTEGTVNELYNSKRVDRKIRDAFEKSLKHDPNDEEEVAKRPTMEQKWQFIQKLAAQKNNYEFANEMYRTLGAVDDENPDSKPGKRRTYGESVSDAGKKKTSYNDL